MEHLHAISSDAEGLSEVGCYSRMVISAAATVADRSWFQWTVTRRALIMSDRQMSVPPEVVIHSTIWQHGHRQFVEQHRQIGDDQCLAYPPHLGRRSLSQGIELRPRTGTGLAPLPNAVLQRRLCGSVASKIGPGGWSWQEYIRAEKAYERWITDPSGG